MVKKHPASDAKDAGTHISSADVKDYILSHLLRNFEEPKSLRAYHLKGRGRKKVLLKTRYDQVALTVEMTTQMFGLKATRTKGSKNPCGCSCVEKALNDLGVFMLTYNGIREVHGNSKEARKLREGLGRLLKPLSDYTRPALVYEIERATGMRIGESRLEACKRQEGVDEKKWADAFFDRTGEADEEPSK
jgi:hypothetical protein